MARRYFKYAFFTIVFTIGLVELFFSPAYAQEITVNLPDGASLSATIVQTFLLLTVLSVAPGIAMMVTCFPFMITVLSIMRQAIGVAQTPPNMMLASLALFLTFYVMQPVFSESWQEGISPYIEGKIEQDEAFEKTTQPLIRYMESNVAPQNSIFMKDLLGSQTESPQEQAEQTLGTPLHVLIPAYMITEIERAFKIGFLIFIPFVVIDLVIAALLMSMGMMMLPPVSISLPVKLAFFTLSDGWSLVASALVRSYQ